MRTKIDYGIDLGTTNSAIARIENGKPTIKKSDMMMDTMPSCITYNIKKDILIGQSALGKLKTDRTNALKHFRKEKSNTYIEFKRTIGNDSKFLSSNMGKEFSSEDLSAEVLMKLKSFITDEAVKSIVITVPAKFTMVQKDATVRAGKLAGFEHIELLQEPIAASMAYGLNSDYKDGMWLVYDFGGGTFDAALIKVEDGIMKVIDTEGDNWLGGKNLDEAIVDQIILPYMEKTFAINDIINDVDKKEILRDAVKFYAEECKIQMSFKDNHNILTDLGDLPFEDENGEEPYIDIDINQFIMENTFAPIFQKSIDICKDLLKRNNLKGPQLATLLLVGGPTYSPILRKMLKEQITDKINTSIDPMTSVATGAALFASTISVSEEVMEQSRDTTKLQLEIKHEATTVEEEEMVNIKILNEKTEGTIPDKVFADVVRGDKAWSSGKKQISGKATLVDIQLNMGASNTFEVILYDEQGNKLECQPNSFNILQGINPGQATLPYHIALEITDRIQGKDILTALKGLEKNQTLPATGVTKGLKTQKDIRPGMASDEIIIPFYQGDYYAEGTTAIHSTHINEIKINGEDLPSLLPAGSDVEITLKVDRSEQMTASIFFPYLNHTEQQTVEIIQGKSVSKEWLENEIIKAKKIAKRLQEENNSKEVGKIIGNINGIAEQLEHKGGGDSGKLEVQDNLLKELRALDKLDSETEWLKVEKELKDNFYDLDELLNRIKSNGDEGGLKMEAIDTHMEEFRVKIEQIIKEKSVIHAKELIEEIDRLDFNIRDILAGPQMDISLINNINSNFSSTNWKDSNKARTLLNQAIQSINSGNVSSLRPILIQILDVMDRDDAEKVTGKLTR
ncbi:Hsp70 family protein [Flavobacterium sp. AC]|uniref:Hsp70 family protein n=1 Tax=Flavobacterium azizsancarii TaxID=2961580 RepID=A0ABT4W9Q2_9FLAO|nr:Hsp70 family protein [Flavobacterium azizsancarii]MDA6069207.1 Hsp70 family protein [Flavobacterium azizsancarii]